MENELRCISHEIRNQVSVCELYSNIIKKKLELKGIKDESIDNALDCIIRSLKLISSNLLDLRALDNFQPKRCDVKTVLKDAVNLSIVYIEEKDIEISLHCENTCDIFTDENKLLACIVNIVKNAIEAIDKKGRIDINVKIIKEKVHILISNNGEAIPKGVDVFKEGFTTKKKGSGLGLAICKSNLEKQNGSLALVKSDDKITEFEIVLEKY